MEDNNYESDTVHTRKTMVIAEDNYFGVKEECSAILLQLFDLVTEKLQCLILEFGSECERRKVNCRVKW